MTFNPVFAPAVLVAIAVALIVVRMVALYRVLVRTGSGRYRRVVLRWCGLTLAVLLLVFAAARPGVDLAGGSADQPNRTAAADPNLNVFFVVDRSVNSRVEDYGDHQSRMAGIRSDMDALIGEYHRARFAVISFASKATLDWPLSDDAWSLGSMVHGLSAYTVAAPDAMYQADPTAARSILAEQLKSAGGLFPGSKNLVFYFGAGDGGSRISPAPFDPARDAIAGGAVLGYGTAAGGPIPQGFVNGTKIYQSDPATGAELTSALDEQRLKNIAGELKVPYFHRDSGQGIAAVLPAVDPPGASADDAGSLRASKLVERRELYWVFTVLSTVLLLVEIVLTIREFRLNRMAREDESR
jgi:Ca-activated chloride channel family protein